MYFQNDFNQHQVEFDLAISEIFLIGNHTFQSKNHRIGCKRNSGFHNQKNDGQDVQLIRNRLVTKLLAKLTKDMEKEKEVGIQQKIIPLKTLVDREGWKVSLLKGMYVANH